MPNHNVLTPDRLAQKVRWEGGIMGALSYGIHADEIEDLELRNLWGRLERAYGELAPLLDQVSTRLGVAA